jgi:hypothetical protein
MHDQHSLHFSSRPHHKSFVLIAQFVGGPQGYAGRDGRRRRRTAARPATRTGCRAGCGPNTRSVATIARAGGCITERGGHFLLADNAGIGEGRVICLTAGPQRVSRLSRDRRGRQDQCNDQRECFLNAPLVPRWSVQRSLLTLQLSFGFLPQMTLDTLH